MRTNGSNSDKEKSRLGPPSKKGSNQLFDGSMLDLEVKGSSSTTSAMEPTTTSTALPPTHKTSSGIQRGPGHKPTNHSHHPRGGSHAHDNNNSSNAHPMTPPRVSGVSLAPKAFEADPIPGFSFNPPEGLPPLVLPGQHQHHHAHHNSQTEATASSGNLTQRGGRRESNEAELTTAATKGLIKGQTKRAPATHAMPNVKLSHAPSLVRDGLGDYDGTNGPPGVSNGLVQDSNGPLQLMAEGKALGGGGGGARGAIAPPQGQKRTSGSGAASLLPTIPPRLNINPPLSPHIDPNLAHYREINGDDDSSMCGTPPALNLAVLDREFDRDHPLGPLSPNPLSPSILTICRGMSLGATRPEKGQKGIYDGVEEEEEEEEGSFTHREGSGVSKPSSRGGLALEDSGVDVDGDGGLSAWARQYQEIQKLPDMRLNLVSPELAHLEKCESPAHLPR